MDDPQTIKVLGFAGSLRKGSYNRMALRAAEELLPDGMTLAIFDITPIPLYNEDVRQAGFPPPVEEFRDKIAAADALLIVTPEYNYSMPGVLKNAIDWASRPPDQPQDEQVQQGGEQPDTGERRGDEAPELSGSHRLVAHHE